MATKKSTAGGEGPRPPVEVPAKKTSNSMSRTAKKGSRKSNSNSQEPESLLSLVNKLRSKKAKPRELEKLLLLVLDHENYTGFTTGLQGNIEDARTFIDILDSVLNILPKYKIPWNRGASSLSDICAATEQFPSSLMISEGLKITGDIPVKSGAYAEVWTGFHNETVVAIKSFRVHDRDEVRKILSMASRETMVWKQLEHPSILPFLGISTFYGLSIVTSWMFSGNINEYCKSHPDANRVRLLHEIVQGVDFLHSHEVIHGDLKGRNIFVDGLGHIRIADYGLIFFTNPLESDIMMDVGINVRSNRDSSRWMSPELLDPTHPSVTDLPTKACDMYAFGMVAIEVFTGEIPFHQVSNRKVVSMIIAGNRPPRPVARPAVGLSDKIWDTIQACWQTKPHKRPEMREIVLIFGTAGCEVKLVGPITTGPHISPVSSPGELTGRSMSNTTRVNDKKELPGRSKGRGMSTAMPVSGRNEVTGRSMSMIAPVSDRKELTDWIITNTPRVGDKEELMGRSMPTPTQAKNRKEFLGRRKPHRGSEALTIVSRHEEPDPEANLLADGPESSNARQKTSNSSFWSSWKTALKQGFNRLSGTEATSSSSPNSLTTEEVIGDLPALPQGAKITELAKNQAAPDSVIHTSQDKIDNIEGDLELVDKLDRDLSLMSSTDSRRLRSCIRELNIACGKTGIVPSSYVLNSGLTKLGPNAVAGGGFGDVWRGKYRDRAVAIKELKVYSTDEVKKLRQNFCKEVVLWKRLSHVNIVPFIGVSITSSNFPFCMVSEWMSEGNLRNYVKKKEGIDRAKLLRDVVNGLEYLHSEHVIHGDLKGDNILINEREQACLCDFGLSSIMVASPTIVSTRCGGGTARWMAPELLDPGDEDENPTITTRHTKETDVYAFGMVCYEVIPSLQSCCEKTWLTEKAYTGTIPFHLYSDYSVCVVVSKGILPKKPEYPLAVGLSGSIWSMMEQCWSKSPETRPGTQKILEILSPNVDLDSSTC